MRGIHRWPVNTQASNAENVSIWWRHHENCSELLNRCGGNPVIICEFASKSPVIRNVDFFAINPNQLLNSKAANVSLPWRQHYSDVIMSVVASQITSLTIVYSTVYSRRRSKKTSKLRVTGLCEGNSPGTGEFPAQMASNAENVSTWWRHHEDVRILLTWIVEINNVQVSMPQ